MPVKLSSAPSINPTLLSSRTSIVFCYCNVVVRLSTLVILVKMLVFCLTIFEDMEPNVLQMPTLQSKSVVMLCISIYLHILQVHA